MDRKIAVPVDGSSFAEFAVPYGVEIARRSNGNVELVMVHDPLPPFAFGEWDHDPQPWEEDYLQTLTGRVRSLLDGRVSHVLRVGDVSGELETHLEESAPELVVMATHGRGPVSRFWLGSVADHLVRHLSRPLLLVRPEEGQEPGEPDTIDLRRAVIPLDGSEAAENVLDPALRLIDLFGSEIVLVRVVPTPPPFASTYLPDTAEIDRKLLDEHREEAGTYLEKAAERLRAEGRTVEIDVRVAPHPATAIRKAAEEHGADLVALATHGRGKVERAVLGSVADKVIRSGTRPTLVCRSGREE